MLFFQNTAVVGGLLGENVQLNLKVWRFTLLCNANSRLVRTLTFDGCIPRRAESRFMPLKTQRLFKKDQFLQSWGELAEPPGAADFCGSAECFDGLVVDERG